MVAHYRKEAPARIRTVPKTPELHGAMCSVCPLRGSQPVFDDGPKAPKIAFIGEAPGRNEVDVGIPFVGPSGVLMLDLMHAYGLKRTDVLFGNAVMCFPPGGDMKAFIQRAKKSTKADVEQLKAKLSAEGVKMRDLVELKALGKLTKKQADWLDGLTSGFKSPIDCCRPRLFFQLGIPRCSACLKWDIKAGEYEDGSTVAEKLSCNCAAPQWVKPPFGRPTAVVPLGNAALESLRGSDGIKKKMMYVFENKERVK